MMNLHDIKSLFDRALETRDPTDIARFFNAKGLDPENSVTYEQLGIREDEQQRMREVLSSLTKEEMKSIEVSVPIPN